jgi:DNA gyrase subunit B
VEPRSDDSETWYPLVRMLAHGVERPIPLKPEFLRSKDYAEMASMGETMDKPD